MVQQVRPLLVVQHVPQVPAPQQDAMFWGSFAAGPPPSAEKSMCYLETFLPKRTQQGLPPAPCRTCRDAAATIGQAARRRSSRHLLPRTQQGQLTVVRSRRALPAAESPGPHNNNVKFGHAQCCAAPVTSHRVSAGVKLQNGSSAKGRTSSQSPPGALTVPSTPACWTRPWPARPPPAPAVQLHREFA